MSGSLQPVGQAVLQIWPRVEQERENAVDQPGPECRAAGAQEHEAGADAVWDRVHSAEHRLQQARESLQAELAMGFTRSAVRPEISAAATSVIGAEWWADYMREDALAAAQNVGNAAAAGRSTANGATAPRS